MLDKMWTVDIRADHDRPEMSYWGSEESAREYVDVTLVPGETAMVTSPGGSSRTYGFVGNDEIGKVG
tara:strand:- start:212 stop:412 length:201 start_codon:yes stop_codon:yes gene_type:complete